MVEIKHDVSVPVQVSLESIKRHPHNIAVMHLATARNAAHLHPQLVNTVDVIFRKPRRVRSKAHNMFDPVGLDYLKRSRAGWLFGRALPGPPQIASLVLGGHLR